MSLNKDGSERKVPARYVPTKAELEAERRENLPYLKDTYCFARFNTWLEGHYTERWTLERWIEHGRPNKIYRRYYQDTETGATRAIVGIIKLNPKYKRS
jgi:hypothetical protein